MCVSVLVRGSRVWGGVGGVVNSNQEVDQRGSSSSMQPEFVWASAALLFASHRLFVLVCPLLKDSDRVCSFAKSCSTQAHTRRRVSTFVAHPACLPVSPAGSARKAQF